MEILVSIMRFTFYDYYLNQASVQDLVKLFENFVINYIYVYMYFLSMRSKITLKFYGIGILFVEEIF